MDSQSIRQDINAIRIFFLTNKTKLSIEVNLTRFMDIEINSGEMESCEIIRSI